MFHETDAPHLRRQSAVMPEGRQRANRCDAPGRLTCREATKIAGRRFR